MRRRVMDAVAILTTADDGNGNDDD